ncbi:MAG: hypothetical protein K8L97_33185 [Anaerolineae bacterium]|nr:hypothetical protein [Anaerolineae bacterium]
MRAALRIVGFVLLTFSLLKPAQAAVRSSGCADLDGRAGNSNGVAYTTTDNFFKGEVITVTVTASGSLVQVTLGLQITLITIFPGSTTITVPNDGSFLFNLESVPATNFDWSITCNPSPDGAGSKTGFEPQCPDGRLNYNHCDKIAIYAVPDGESYGMRIYVVEPDGIGKLALTVSARDLALLTKQPDHIGTSADGKVIVYRLTSGEYQVNYGPDTEGKVFEFTFDGLPPTAYPNVHTYMDA